MSADNFNRRSFLRSIGAAGAIGGSVSFAGCIELGGGDDVAVGEQFPEIQFVYPTSGANSHRNELGEFIADNLEEVGFEVDRQRRQFDPHVNQTLIDHDFDVSLLGWGGTPERIDPNIFLYDLHHSDGIGAGGRNTPAYSNPDYDELAEAQSVELDPEARRDIVYECQEMLGEDQPRCYIANEGGDHPYNTDRITSVNPTLGEGLNGFWNFMDMEVADGVEEVLMGYPGDIISLNPMQDMATPDRQIIRLIYDQLYRFDEQGDPIPWLATDQPEIDEDGPSFTVEVRDDHQFHDGEPVTVDDVLFSYEYFGEFSSTYASYLDPVEEMNVSGSEITFHLSRPDATFVSNALAQIYIFPEHIWGDIDDPTQESDENYIGSGPFKFQAWQREVEMQLERFDEHFHPPNIPRLIRVPGDAGALMDELEAYQLDFVGHVPTTSQMNRINEDESLDGAEWSAIGHAKLAYNFRREHMTDVHVRRAISYCVPKETYVEDIRGGMGTVTHSPIAPVVETWHNPDTRQYNEDLERAEEELEAGGYVWDSDGVLHYPEEEA